LDSVRGLFGFSPVGPVRFAFALGSASVAPPWAYVAPDFDWILTGGSWDDAGLWDDSSSWID
jgi:hypothetical protein